jgi:hypothetical protein
VGEGSLASWYGVVTREERPETAATLLDSFKDSRADNSEIGNAETTPFILDGELEPS